ncbi:hypothetical protein COU88_04690 [Candidatus Roizmanbacteria bacterium CG10_big_fil_rev_8_21_14_0_10_39_6]|uniref:Glycosyltransferase 2-like domain-containing protein n=1 Tax=Candidatus Roizmanbacteria bacterium CG10_big_fil_rev_8_21_14_0_10_39_6 TaxID=1974853 RepID=A0A2M8KRE5_9BACT|nr:MAG: hypothetical protein COU88_04690 [Candidatus Roizmanbacteria bacterium CG10_big_fil_rev_8_21_14_0_10_39_6]
MKLLYSIIIPVKEVNDYIRYENLPAFEKQIYKNFEVLVLPNNIREKDKELLTKYPFLRIIPTGSVTRPALKRDIGAKNAKGEVLAFIDDDAYPKSDWLKHANSQFIHENISCVCGPGILPKNTNVWEKIFNEILVSPIGSGGYGYRFTPQKTRSVDDYPSMNFLITKKLFARVGGFNNNFWPGEDSKLCNDIVYKEHEKILYSPNVVMYHHRRNSLLPYLHQHMQYGYHRGAFIAVGDKNSQKINYFLPLFFLLYCLSLPVLIPFFTPLYFAPLIAYLFLSVAIAVKAFLKYKNVFYIVAIPSVLFLTHMLYGISFLKGLVVGSIKKDKIYG